MLRVPRPFCPVLQLALSRNVLCAFVLPCDVCVSPGVVSAIDDSALILQVPLPPPCLSPPLPLRTPTHNPEPTLNPYKSPRCRPPSCISRLTSNQWIQQQKPSLPALFPPASESQCDVSDVCARFDKSLGPAVRVWVYWHLIGETAPHTPPCKRFSTHCFAPAQTLTS
jgi:hypothetical protein